MNFSKDVKENLMRIVMEEVNVAIEEGNSPFAAILIDEQGKIIEKAHNTAKLMCNPVLHAEINLISKVCKKLNTRDLSKYCIMSNAWSCKLKKQGKNNKCIQLGTIYKKRKELD